MRSHISIVISERSLRQIDELEEKTKLTINEIITVAIDRLAKEELLNIETRYRYGANGQGDQCLVEVIIGYPHKSLSFDPQTLEPRGAGSGTITPQELVLMLEAAKDFIAGHSMTEEK
jgi:hypothetical protein